MMCTFILNFRGGTYIEQVEAQDVLEATHIWAERTAADPEIEHLDGAVFRKTFQQEIEEFPPSAIGERRNVWHLFYFTGRNRMDVHIVKTTATAETIENQQFAFQN